MKHARGGLALLARADPAAGGIDHKSVHSGLPHISGSVGPSPRQNCHSLATCRHQCHCAKHRADVACLSDRTEASACTGFRQPALQIRDRPRSRRSEPALFSPANYRAAVQHGDCERLQRDLRGARLAGTLRRGLCDASRHSAAQCGTPRPAVERSRGNRGAPLQRWVRTLCGAAAGG